MTEKPMKRSAVLRQAAKIAHDLPACGCWAIYGQAVPNDLKDAAARVFLMFKPDPLPKQYMNMPTWFGLVKSGAPGHSVRVLALCFAAAIAQWEETH